MRNWDVEQPSRSAAARPSPFVQVLKWTQAVLLGLAVVSFAVAARNVYDHDAFATTSLKSLAKAVYWFFGQCLWCTGRETTEGIFLILASGGGYVLGIFAPLLLYAGLGLVRKRLERRAAAAVTPTGLPPGAVSPAGSYEKLRPAVPLLAALAAVVWFLSGAPPDESPSSAASAATGSGPMTAAAFLDAPLAKAMFVVQVGSFDDEVRAHRVNAMLSDAGLPSFVTVPLQGRVRVRMGPYETRDAAELAAGQARKLSLPATVLDVTHQSRNAD